MLRLLVKRFTKTSTNGPLEGKDSKYMFLAFRSESSFPRPVSIGLFRMEYPKKRFTNDRKCSTKRPPPVGPGTQAFAAAPIRSSKTRPPSLSRGIRGHRSLASMKELTSTAVGAPSAPPIRHAAMAPHALANAREDAKPSPLR